MAIGRRLSGIYNFTGDRDWIRLTLRAGHTYRFDLTGSALTDPNLSLRDAKGRRRAYNDDANGRHSQITYTATTAGTYFLDAGSSSKGTGTYTLQAADITPKDDFGSSTATAGIATVGRGVTGTVNFLGDRDWFRVTLKADHTYTFDLTGSQLLDATLALRDAKGSRRAYNDDAIGRHSQITYKAIKGGTYYLDAGSTSKGTGTYTLRVTDTTPSDDFNGSTDTKGTIAVGRRITGVVQFNGDRDWFQVQLAAGRTYRFNLTGHRLVDPTLALRDSSGARRAFNDDAIGRHSQITYTAPTAGPYFLDAGAYGKATGSYTLQVADTTPKDDFASSAATKGAIAVGGRVSGMVNFNGDRDWFRVELAAGRTYRLNLNGIRLSNPTLALRDASGMRRAFNDDAKGRDSQITFTAPSGGSYFLDAGAYSSGTGSYTLQLADVTPKDDYTASSDTKGVINIGRRAAGVVHSNGDRDWFRVQLKAGTTYRFNLNGGSLVDPLFRLRDGGGNQLVVNDDTNGLDSQIIFTAPAEGTYFLDAGAYSSGTGSYSILSAETTPPPAVTDDFAATASTSGVLTLDGASSGVVNFNRDRDWFRISLQAGRTYRFTLNGDSLADPDLRLRDADGRSLTFNNDFDGPHAQITFTPSTAATFFLDAGANGAGIGSYTLLATDTTPAPTIDDYGDTARTSGSLTTAASSSGVVNFNGDHDWFAISLQAGRSYNFSVEGDTLRDPDLSLRDSLGQQVGFANDSGGARNPILTFTATTSSVYYLDVGSNNDVGTGSYRVLAKDTLSEDDFAANSNTRGSLDIGESTTGRINFNGDRDWFRLSLEATSTYQFTLDGTALTEPELALRDVNGNLLASNEGATGGQPQITFTPLSTGLFYLDIGVGRFNSTGSYAVSALRTAVSMDDYLADTSSDGRVDIGGQTSGSIDFAEDHDWFRVSLRAGRRYQFNLKGNTLHEPLLRLLDEEGRTVLAKSDNHAPGSNAQIVYTSLREGLYFLDVAAVDALTGSYVLQVSDATVEPDRISGLQDQDIRAQINTFLRDNLFSHQELQLLLRRAGREGVTAQELTDLRTIADQFRPFLADASRPYYQYIYNAVVNGNPANEYWTGGASDSVSLGNLAAGSIELQMNRLVDKWFAGLDLPTNFIEGDAAANRSPLHFAYRDMTGSLFADDISFSDVNQGMAGTCYFLAACLTFAHSQKQLISALFRDNGDGTYGVRFYGETGHEIWVTVNRSVPVLPNGRLALAGNNSGSLAGEMWVALAEKAYAQANEIGVFGRSNASNSYSRIEGGCEEALRHLSGHVTTTYSAYYSSGDWSGIATSLADWNGFEAQAISAMIAGRSLWLGSFGATTDTGGKFNFVEGHAFSILDYDVSTGRFTIANPWGAGPSYYADVFEASWRDLYPLKAIVSWA